MPNPTDRLENLLALARAAVYRTDRTLLYSAAIELAATEYQRWKGDDTAVPGLRNIRLNGSHLVAVDHSSLTWTFYTSMWYWQAANVRRMGIRDVRAIPSRAGKHMGVWLTKDQAKWASAYTSRKKAAGATPPRKEWAEWWQSYKAVHKDITNLMGYVTAAIAAKTPFKAAVYWGDIVMALQRCFLAADRGPLWPKELVKKVPAAPKERPVPAAVPVLKMRKTGHPNRICADGIERWRFSTSYRRCAEELGLGELDPNGRHVWLAEGQEHSRVATLSKAKNNHLSISLGRTWSRVGRR